MEVVDIKIEQDYKVKQIWPAHADHISYYKESFLNDMFKRTEVVAQRKYDGERMLIHFNGNEVYCTSRRISKKTGHFMENQDKLLNLPRLTALGYTIIDCECYADTWADAVGVLHSLPDRAKELQQNVDIKFACFDCIFYNNMDLRELPYDKRCYYLMQVLDKLKAIDGRFHFVDEDGVCCLDEAYTVAEEYWKQGLEGVVIKPLDAKYYDKGAMLKIKRHETVDVVVYDYQEGTGKYAGTVGALLVGYYDPQTDTIKHLSKVNCGTDADRDYWRDNWSALRRTVLEVKCQEITDKSLRHPVYVRIRDDKDYKMCTKDTIFKE